MSEARRHWPRVIGIVGGLGPHAHIQLERAILDAVEAERDQDYPDWVLASLPWTPDRTDAIEGRAESPVPYLVAALERLRGAGSRPLGGEPETIDELSRGADFAVIACVTAHHFLPQVRSRTDLPILDIVEESVRVAHGPGRARIGILATTGTLETRVFERAAEHVAPGLELISPLDLDPPGGLQEELVMGPVYRGIEGGRSIKAGGAADPDGREALAGALGKAAGLLIDRGAEAIILGCTEIPLVLDGEAIGRVALIDPLRQAARAAVEIASGRRDLPPP